MHCFLDLFDKYSACFGQIHCPSSGVSQHCIHAIGICHASSLASASVTLADDSELVCVYSVEILLMMDSGHVQNM